MYMYMCVCLRVCVCVCVCVCLRAGSHMHVEDAHLMRWLRFATSIVVCDWVVGNMATMDGCTTMGGWNFQCDFVVYHLH